MRVDDRGVGGSSGKTAASTSEDFAGDVEAGIATLKVRPDINPKAIGLIGHSEGGIIAPLVAARSSDVAFIVLLAGTGVPGDQIVTSQLGLILRALGTDAKKVDQTVRTQRRLLAVVTTEKDEQKAKQATPGRSKAGDRRNCRRRNGSRPRRRTEESTPSWPRSDRLGTGSS